MKQYGLIGKSITHSFSKRFFTKKFTSEHIAAQYELYHLDNIDEFPAFLAANPNLAGLNVTIPYKQAIMRFVTELDVSARMVGAVNAIKIEAHKTNTVLKGFNTDVIGFEGLLSVLLDKNTKNRALILGTGGASRAVQYVLRKNGIGFLLVSRGSAKHGQINYTVLSKSVLNKYNIIINTTPLGMSPDIEGMPPIPYQHITSNHTLIDLIYNPEQTKFLELGKNAGAKIANGMQMFELQAEASWNIWNEKK